MAEFSEGEIVNREHIAPDKTGDNIAAKRSANYVWNGSAWVRMTQSAGGGGGTEYTDGDVAATHPVGGTVTYSKAGVVTAVSDSNPLPTTATITGGGDASAANQTTEISKLTSIDGKITAVNTGAVVVSSSALPSGASTSAKQPALGTAGTPSADVITVQGKTSMTPLLTDGSATTQPVSAAALPLPSGASTSAKQDTGNTSLSSIDTKLPAQGQALAAGSVPVVLPAAQITTLTPPAAITGFATSTKQDTGNTSVASIDTKTPALGQALSAASVPVVLPAAQVTTLTPPAAITGFSTSTKQSDGSQKSQIVDGSGNVIGATSNALDVNIKSGAAAGTQYTEDAPAAADPIGNMTMAVRRDTLSTTEVSADGDNIAIKATNKGQMHVKLADTVTVDGSAVTQPVSGTITANAGTNLNTSALALDATVAKDASLTTLNTSVNALLKPASTLATVSTVTNLSQLGGAAIAMGTGVRSAGTQRVTIATDDVVPVTGTFWQTTQPVSLATNTPTIAAGTAIIGKVGIDQTTDGTTNKVYVGNIPHVVVDSAPSTAVTGSVTANAGTNLNTSALALDATLTGGTAKAINRGGAKGTTTAADITSTASGSNHQPMDVAIYDASGNQITSFGGGTQYADAATAATPTGTQANWNEAGTQRATSLTKPLPIQAGTGVTIPVSLATNTPTLQSGSTTAVTQATGTNLHTVVDSGTITAVTAITNALPAGTNLLGKTGIDQTTDGTTNKVYVGNIPHVIVDTAPSTAVTNAGTFAVQATLAAETTKVIGTVRNADGSGNLFTSNSSTYTAKFAQDANLLGTLGTAFSTAGKVDVKAADGDVFVRQATASNLNATVVGTGTFAVQATLAAGATSIAKAEDVASADADVGVPAMAIRKATPANTSGTDGDYEMLQISAGRQWVWAQPNVTTISTTITRPADTAAYAANDAFANSTSAPTAGGFTLTGAALASGGTGIITDAVITASAGTNYIGEIWIFDQAVTATNDNAALSVADADILNLVGVIPFQTSDVNAANSISYVTGLNIGYTCVGTANLRFLVKIMSAVTPGNAEVLSVRIKVQN